MGCLHFCYFFCFPKEKSMRDSCSGNWKKYWIQYNDAANSYNIGSEIILLLLILLDVVVNHLQFVTILPFKFYLKSQIYYKSLRLY
jgi:hypothetical protein